MDLSPSKAIDWLIIQLVFNDKTMLRIAVIEPGQQLSDFVAAMQRSIGVQIVAVVGQDESARNEAADRLNTNISVATLEQLLTSHDDAIDAVAINSAWNRRVSEATEAARAGKHLLIETPLAATSRDAEKIVNTCHSADVRLMVGQRLRFQPYQQIVKQRLDSGQLGKAGLLRIHHWASAATVGGGNRQSEILDLIVRELDLAGWLFNASPTTVYAVSTSAPNSTLADYVQIHLGFEDGTMALINCQRQSKSVAQPYYMLTLIGSDGAAYADDHYNTHLLLQGNRSNSVHVAQGQDALRLQLEEFADAVKQGREPSSCGADAIRALTIAEAVADSLPAGRAAHWKGDRYELD